MFSRIKLLSKSWGGLGESGADAFVIMRFMGHSSITISQKYVHPTAGRMEDAIIGVEQASETWEQKQREAEKVVPTISPTVEGTDGAIIQ